MSDNFTVVKMFDLDGVKVQLRNYSGNKGIRAVHQQDVYTIGLMEKCPSVRARYPGWHRSGSFVGLGAVSARPPRVAWEFDTPQPRADVLICVIDPRRFERTATELKGWTDEALSKSLNIQCGFVAESLRLLRREILLSGNCDRDYINAIVNAMIRRLGKYLSDDNNSDTENHRIISEIENLILNTWDIYPKCGDLADFFGISGRTLRRQYTTAAGESLQECIARLQHQKALHLLRSTNMPVKQISFRLGFNHQGNFATAFRRWAGMTPAQFRRTA